MASMAAARVQRWAIVISAYNYSLNYRSGSENPNANYFSRFPSSEKDSFSLVKNEVFMAAHRCPSHI